MVVHLSSIKSDQNGIESFCCHLEGMLWKMIKSDQNGIERRHTSISITSAVKIKSDQNGIERVLIIVYAKTIEADKIRPKWD